MRSTAHRLLAIILALGSTSGAASAAGHTVDDTKLSLCRTAMNSEGGNGVVSCRDASTYYFGVAKSYAGTDTEATCHATYDAAYSHHEYAMLTQSSDAASHKAVATIFRTCGGPWKAKALELKESMK